MIRSLRNAVGRVAVFAMLAIFGALAVMATVYTQAVTVTSAAWVNLGAGPIAVGTNSYVGVWIVASDSAPNTSPNIAGFGTVLSQNVGPTPPIQTFCGTTNYWALAIGGSPSNPASTTLNVTPTNCGGAGSQNVVVTNTPGSVGHDYSANTPTLPVIGANFGSTGVYANYVLVATVPASASRTEIEVLNSSGAQIAVLLDDGTAATSTAPVNATLFALAGGTSAGAQGASWWSQTFKGRVQVYALSSSAQIAINAR